MNLLIKKQAVRNWVDEAVRLKGHQFITDAYIV